MPSRQTILHTCGGPGASLAKSAADFFAGRPGRDGLEDAIRAMDAVPVVRMTIAFSPSARALSTWQKDAARALSGPCILEVTVDEAVAAGAVIDMKGTLFRSVLADEIDK